MIIYRRIHPAPNTIKAMERARTQVTHAPWHGVGAVFVPVGFVLSGSGTHLKSIFLSPFFSSKYPSWHWKLHSVLSSTLVFGSLSAWIVTFAVDCSFSLLHPPASMLRPLISFVVAVQVCAAEHGQKIVKWKNK